MPIRPSASRSSKATRLLGSAIVVAASALLFARMVLPQAESARAQSGLEHAYRLVDTWEGQDVQSPVGALLYPAGLDATAQAIFVVDRGNHRIEAFNWDGALVAAFGQRGSGLGSLDDPRDLAVDGNRVFVLDRGNRRVAVFGLDGSPIETWEDLGLVAPWGIAAAAGRLYISEPEAGEVVVAEAGAVLARWAVDGDPRGLDLGPDGNLRVARPAAGRVSTYGPSGALLGELIEPDPAKAPWDLSVDDDNGLYLLSARAILWYEAGANISRQAMYRNGLVGVSHVARKGVVGSVVDDDRAWHGLIGFDWHPREGDPIFSYPRLGFPQGRFEAPHAIHAGADGRIYVLDAWPRVQSLEKDGSPALQQVPALVPSRPFEPVDIAVRTDGRMLVVEPRHLTMLGRNGVVSSSLALRQGNVPLWGTAITLRDSGRRTTLLDSAELQLLNYGITTTLRPLGGQPLADPELSWSLWWDVAAADSNPDGRLYLAHRGARRVEVIEAGSPVGSWEIEGIPMRLAVGPDGDLHVLTRGGIVYEYAPDGRLVAAWDAASVSAKQATEVIDLTVDSEGRVYTVDRAAGTVRIWARDPGAMAEPPARRGQGCQLRGDKRAAPASVVIGDSVTVTLSIGGDCPSDSSGADIILAIDRSYSMLADNKITDTIAAGLAFVEGIDFAQDRVAVVSFNNKASLVQGLSADRSALRAAIAGLSPVGGTNIAAALDQSAQELAGARGRAEADKVVVLLTDGKDDEPEAVLRAATRLKAVLGTQLFTIGFGDVDPMVMVRAASSPEDNYYAPDASTLGDIYAEIARRLSATVLARQLQISDTLPANMRYLGPAGGPAPRVSGQVLTWDLVDLPFSGIDLAYRVEPLALGRHPTNVEALADFRDGLDEPGSLRFPVPEVMVVNVAPTPTSTSTPFPTPTPKPPATATPRPPEPIFLPIAVWQTCRDRTVLADVVLVIDTSGSMNAPASGSDGPTRLEAAVDAAARFVDGLLSGGSGNRVALVSFNLEAGLDQPLTTDVGAVRAALAALATVQGTRIDRGIEVAAAELTGERANAANSRVLVLLTDGRVDDVEDSVVIDAAGRAKEAGILLVAIGLGDAEAVDFELLGAVASGPDLVFRAPSASDLAAIYAQIAYTIECPNLDWP